MRKNLQFLLLLIIGVLVLAGCGTSKEKEEAAPKSTAPNAEEKEGSDQVANAVYPQLSNEVSENEKLVEIETTMGNIKIKLFPEYAPKAVENFLEHSEEGYYDGLIFHRVINDFMIQGGDPNGDGTGGESIYGKPFEDEFSNNLFNLRGALSMANSGANTNGSQFFIVQKKSVDPSIKTEMEKAGFANEVIEAYEELGGTPWLDNRHTVFGHVVEGMDIVDKIAETPVDPKDKPEKDVVIKGIKVLK
ncbi:peptidylprolyl isomerase [Bacillus sp. EB106-08-02-XG196]|uniref:peptidylprolyl isomerase n=1 Tax=Bacillus sp. EB106-08-02-XG196 TaxID=2737049 RepID=UPI0015C41714|nr:peptidylprolyl isomerase [Bacillus sp. EB106-08-02-XG196]NWQ39274.1 peptidylprolyl isomerase [Bacillus sp. EB106-08-02-XG196]